MPDGNVFKIVVAAADAGQRLDVLVAARIPSCSRAYAAVLIRRGEIRVRDAVKKAGYRVKAGDEVRGRLPPPVPAEIVPEPMELDILYADEQLIVINKPAGRVVHPAAGHSSGTLVHGLLYQFPDLEGIGGERRPGIVHRLDKDTSGVMLVAKNAAAHRHLAAQFKSRKIQKRYLALVYGRIKTDAGSITLPLGRHPLDRKRMSIVSRRTRNAETHWQVRERLNGATLIDIDLKTGRTHQIRVHCAAIHHPVVGDAVYGGRRAASAGAGQDKAAAAHLNAVQRQMLHASRITFLHPGSLGSMVFEAPLPEDMQRLIQALRSSGGAADSG